MAAVQKLQFLLRDHGTEHTRLSENLLTRIAPRLLAEQPGGLKLHLTRRPPRLSLVPFQKHPLALVTIWTRGDPADWAMLLSNSGLKTEGYRVRSSVPVAYPRDWPDGQKTPGVGLLTLLRRKPGLSDEVFLREWHGHHTPKSLRIHPLWNYVRNEVTGTMDEATPPLDGIVEEHFKCEADLLNPLRLFGGPLVFLKNAIEVGLHIRRFLDLSSLETYLVDERILLSPAAQEAL